MTGSVFEGCYAGNKGGALGLSSGGLTVTSSVFSNNSAGSDNVKDGERRVVFEMTVLRPLREEFSISRAGAQGVLTRVELDVATDGSSFDFGLWTSTSLIRPIRRRDQ